MRDITEREIIDRLNFDNPWWGESAGIDPAFRNMPIRDYLGPFEQLVLEKEVNRAVILMGPRRVGKTVMVYQTIQHMIDSGVPGRNILYLSLETPIYTGLTLEKLLKIYLTLFKHDISGQLYIFFDEIQYLRDWEIHLKSLVDSYRRFKFSASGSAAAALRLKSRESGAGRFTDFLLPPLTFAEYLRFINRSDELITGGRDGKFFTTGNIEALNEEFLRYMNFGGYPEAVFSPHIQAASSRYIKSDIIDKVLLRDLPSLYGISDIQELNRLFTTVAYNTGDEVSLEGLSKSSGVVKNTLKKYLEYLEAAFLIRRVYRIDQNAKHFKRATTFKVYLTNPSMHSALFGPISDSNGATGKLVETAIFSQWFHDPGISENIYYARWKRGEVDIVSCDKKAQNALWVVEVKWSDRCCADISDIAAVIEFSKSNGIVDPLITTLTQNGDRQIDGINVRYLPSSLYCYTVGKNLVQSVIKEKTSSKK